MAVVGNDGGDFGPIGTHRSDTAHQTPSRDDIHVYGKPVIFAFVDNKPGITAYDSGPHLVVAAVLFIQVKELSEFVELVFVLLQQGVLFRQRCDLLLQPGIFIQDCPDLLQLVRAVSQPQAHFSDTLLQGNDHIPHHCVQRLVKAVVSEGDKHQYGTEDG